MRINENFMKAFILFSAAQIMMLNFPSPLYCNAKILWELFEKLPFISHRPQWFKINLEISFYNFETWARHFWYFSKTVLSCFVARLLGFLKSVWMITQEPTKKLKNGLLPSRYAWHFPQNFCKQHHPKASHKQESVVVGRQFQYKILLLTSFFAFGLDVVVGLHA